MDWKKQTISVYDNSAKEIAEYFKGIGSRKEDIEKALELANAKEGGNVIEIGCGDGRDAAEILKRLDQYIGVDPSEGLLGIARESNPTGTFVKADALSYEYPSNLDVIFAFASLLHIDQNDLHKVFEKAKEALKIGGIFYISLKEKPEYEEVIQEDKYGTRMFYYYNADIIKQLAGSSFERVYGYQKTMGHTDWFTIALKKIS